jgi:DNA-directed RNA polymerase sigma subunit (sigma70/sigma32)
MPRFIRMDLYHRYRDKVWKLTNAKQRYEPGKVSRGLSDEEIAARLKLSVEEVTEIRCVAENETISLENYLDAEETKEKRYRKLPAKKRSQDELQANS